jgi:hypothetical protein
LWARRSTATWGAFSALLTEVQPPLSATAAATAPIGNHRITPCLPARVMGRILGKRTRMAIKGANVRLISGDIRLLLDQFA